MLALLPCAFYLTVLSQGLASEGVPVPRFARADYASGVGSTGATWVEVGDLNGDGLFDLAVANRSSATVGSLLGSPFGTFTPPAEFAVLSGPNTLALGDLNGDGVLDAVVGHRAAPRSLILRGSGSGGFQTIGSVADDVDSRTVRIGDFDLDGSLDFAIANYTTRKISYAFGNGLGGFPDIVDVGFTPAPTHFDCADLDLDGDLDAAVAVADSGEFGTPLIENLGARTFDGSLITFFTGIPVWVAIGDVTGDGIPDLSAPTDDGLGALLEPKIGVGNLAFTFVASLLATTEMNEIGDFNQDGLQDNVYANGSSQQGASIVLSDGVGGGAVYGIPTGAPQPLHIAVADLDGDGLDDFVTANGGSAGVSVLWNLFCDGPRIASIEPASVPNVSAQGPAQVTLGGTCFSAVKEVSVGGVPLEPEAFEVLSDSELTFSLPLVAALGPVDVVVDGPDGSATTELELVAANPAALHLANADPLELDPSVGAVATLGAAPDSLFLLFASPDLVPTSLPGLLELEIGAAGTTLFLLSSGTLPEYGWFQGTYSIAALPPGFGVHFQGALLASLATPPPLEVTDAASGTVGR